MTRAWNSSRPKNYYLHCIDRPRPCPWVGCKHHLLLDVNEATGSITLNVGRTTKRNVEGRRDITSKRRTSTIPARGLRSDAREKRLLERATEELFHAFDEALEGKNISTCVLDCVAGENSYTLEDVGQKLSVTRERIRQIEARATGKLRALSNPDDPDNWAEIED
jgi:hypothetical protein